MKAAVLAMFGLCTVTITGHATTIPFASSGDFLAAISSLPTQIQENYGSSDFTDGQLIALGTTIHGITYSNFVGFTNTDITNQYNSLTGLSLGADHTVNGANQTFFYGGNSIDISFDSPVFAVGAFFNVALNSGSFLVKTSMGTASTDSVVYDIGTFVFAGLVSDTPFTTATLTSTDINLGSFNIPEIFGASAAATAIPEPASLAFAFLGLATLAFRRIRR